MSDDDKALAALPRVARLSVAFTTEIELAKLPDHEAALALALTIAALTRQNSWREAFVAKMVADSFSMFDHLLDNIDPQIPVPERVRE